MTPVVIGRHLRTLRHRKRMRQVDLARKTEISQSTISRVERGDLGVVSAATLGRIFDAVEAELIVSVRWRGGELDRLADRAHARLVELVTQRLTRLGWQVFPEVTFSHFGERGSIDVLAWDPVERAVVIGEVKSEIAGVEETLRRHDAKVRLATVIVRERFGVAPRTISKLLILPESATARRRIAEHASTFERAYPDRGAVVRDRLAARNEAIAGILYEEVGPEARLQGRRRVRVAPEPTANLALTANVAPTATAA